MAPEALWQSRAAWLQVLGLLGMSLQPLAFLHWLRVMQIFGERQVSAGDEAHAGSMEAVKDRVHLLRFLFGNS